MDVCGVEVGELGSRVGVSVKNQRQSGPLLSVGRPLKQQRERKKGGATGD